MYPSFSKAGVTTFTFSRGQDWPDDSSPQPRQTVSYSEAGQGRVVTYPGEEEMYPLNFTLLPLTDDAALLVFLRHALILWSAYKFTYTSVASVARTVRLLEGSYKRSEVAGGVNISLTLRREFF